MSLGLNKMLFRNDKDFFRGYTNQLSSWQHLREHDLFSYKYFWYCYNEAIVLKLHKRSNLMAIQTNEEERSNFSTQHAALNLEHRLLQEEYDRLMERHSVLLQEMAAKGFHLILF